MGLTLQNTVLNQMIRVPRMYDNHSKSLETFSGRLQREPLNCFKHLITSRQNALTRGNRGASAASINTKIIEKMTSSIGRNGLQETFWWVTVCSPLVPPDGPWKAGTLYLTASHPH